MCEYQVWWKVKESGQILHDEVMATSKEDAEKCILDKHGYKAWEIIFTTVKIM